MNITQQNNCSVVFHPVQETKYVIHVLWKLPFVDNVSS